MPPDAATMLSEGSPPPLLIACRRSFPTGFNPVVFILLVLLVQIVAFAFMMMVVEDRNGECQSLRRVLWSCDYDDNIVRIHIRPSCPSGWALRPQPPSLTSLREISESSTCSSHRIQKSASCKRPPDKEKFRKRSQRQRICSIKP